MIDETLMDGNKLESNASAKTITIIWKGENTAQQIADEIDSLIPKTFNKSFVISHDTISSDFDSVEEVNKVMIAADYSAKIKRVIKTVFEGHTEIKTYDIQIARKSDQNIRTLKKSNTSKFETWGTKIVGILFALFCLNGLSMVFDGIKGVADMWGSGMSEAILGSIIITLISFVMTCVGVIIGVGVYFNDMIAKIVTLLLCLIIFSGSLSMLIIGIAFEQGLAIANSLPLFIISVISIYVLCFDMYKGFRNNPLQLI